VAVATDAALTCDRTLLPLNEPARVAEWTLRFLESTAYIQQSLSG
jgi:hypothetical protein